MKRAIPFLLFIFSSAAFAEICTSKDFNAQTYDGQKLELIFSRGELVSVEKMKGSWYCDKGKVNRPKVLSSDAKATVYDVDFHCDESEGRLVVPADFESSRKVTYSFSDPESGHMKWVLFCK